MKWRAVLVFVIGCHAPHESAPIDAGTMVVNGPPGWDHLADATLVEIHDTSKNAGRDIVMRFEREHDSFSWTAKASPYPFVLGATTPESAAHRSRGCTCASQSVCACELADHPVPPPAVRRGTIESAKILAFLKVLAERTAKIHVDVDASDPNADVDRAAQIGIFVPGAEMLQLTLDAGWSVNGKKIEGDATAIDTSINALMNAIDIASFMPAIPTLPPTFSSMADHAKVLEIKDVWVGLRHSHDAFIRLERAGNQYAWTAKVAAYGVVAEHVPDPTTANEHMRGTCQCDIASTCPCERATHLLRKKGNVSADLVHAFLFAVESHTLAIKDDGRVFARWTDDYPHAHVAVWTDDATDPIHLGFTDQTRRWRKDGVNLSLDPRVDVMKEMGNGQHPKINKAYYKLLEAIGLNKWADELGQTGR